MINRLLLGLAVGGVATVGAVGVGLGYSDTVSLVADDAPVPGSAGSLTYFGCPNVGPMGELRDGDRVYLTGRDGSGGWVQVRSPEHRNERVWVRGEHVDPDSVVDLPAEDCSSEPGEMALVDPDAPTTTTSSVPETIAPETTEPSDDTPTTAPTTTQPGQTTTTTAPPATTTSTTTTTTTTTAPPVAPTFGSVQRSQPAIKEDFSDNCANLTAVTSTISTSVSHPSGAVTVQFRTRLGDGAWSSWQTVATQPGSVQGQIGPYAPDTLPYDSTAEVSWQFRALPTDGGPVATRTSTGNETVTLNWCSLA